MTLLVVDVEATCWPDEQPELRQRQRQISEIIEIGAVRLTGDTLRPSGEYQAFVRPEQHAELSAFCRSLTSIDQSDVDGAPTFADAWAAFVAWIGQPLDQVTMVSWSNYDQHLFVRQCAEVGVPAPGWQHVDLKAEFGRWVFAQDGTRARFRLGEGLDRVGIDAEGTAHRAIDDARNTAELLRCIRDPHRAGLLTLHALRVVRDRHPEPTHQGHLRDVLPDVRRWYPRIRYELLRMGLVEELDQGRGLVLRAYGREVMGTLGLDALPPPRDPSAKGAEPGPSTSG